MSNNQSTLPMVQTPAPNLRIYAVGGAGINNALKLDLSFGGIGVPSDIEITLVDTTMSNLRNYRSLDGSKYYDAHIIQGQDGLGKDLKVGIEVAKEHIPSILQANPPKQFNILIYSLSGATGSTIGTSLLLELLKNNSNVIPIIIASTASKQECINSLKIMKNIYHMINNEIKKPVVMVPLYNSESHPRDMVDKSVNNMVKALSLLFSGSHSELDTTDLKNTLYLKTLDVQGGVFELSLLTSNSKQTENDKVISVINLLDSTSSPELNVGQLYQCTGYMHTGVINSTQDGIKSLYFTISPAQEHIKILSDILPSYDKTNNILKEELIKQNESVSLDDEDLLF